VCGVREVVPGCAGRDGDSLDALAAAGEDERRTLDRLGDPRDELVEAL